MKKILFIVFFAASVIAKGQAPEVARISIRDSATSLTDDTDLVLIGKGTGGVNIEGEYTLSKTDGTAGQAMLFNGDGTMSPGDVSSVTPAALTKTDDTNVTLTLGGTPSTALLEATSLTLGWTGNLAVARGGSGAGTFTDGGILYGNGTSAFSVTSAPAGADEFLVSTGAGTWGLESASSARTSLGLGTMATQNATSVNIDGGSVNGTVIGDDTPAAGSFTSIDASGVITNTRDGEVKVVLSRTGSDTYSFGLTSSTFKIINATDVRTDLSFDGAGAATFSGSLSAGAITSTPLAGTGNNLLYTPSGGTITRSTIDIADVAASIFLVDEQTITTAQIGSLNSTPITLISAQGAGTFIVIHKIAISMDYQSTQWSDGGTLVFEYSGGVDIITLTNSIYTATSDRFTYLGINHSISSDFNSSIQLTTGTSDPSGGNSELKVKIWYTIESL